MSDDFNPFVDVMPWDDKESKPNDDNAVSIAPVDKQGESPVEQPSESQVRDTDIFTALEEKLKLPIGSTKEALEPHKQLTKRIDIKTQKLEADLKLIKAQEKMSETGLTKLTPEVFDRDRLKVREEAHRLYDISKNFLDKLQEQVDSTLDVSDKMWSAVSSMISSVTNSLEKLVNITVKLRQEEELRSIELQKVEDAKKALDDDGTIELVPDQTNIYIANLVEEHERKIKLELGLNPDEENEDKNENS